MYVCMYQFVGFVMGSITYSVFMVSDSLCTLFGERDCTSKGLRKKDRGEGAICPPSPQKKIETAIKNKSYWGHICD